MILITEIKDVIQWVFEDLKTELDKTILICKNCHSEVNSGIITDKKIKKIVGKEKFNEMMEISWQNLFISYIITLKGD